MNDSHDPLENELRALHPAETSPHVRAAIAGALAAPPPATSMARWPRRARLSLLLAWSVAGAAACFAGLTWWRSSAIEQSGAAVAPVSAAAPTASDDATAGRTVPVASTNVLFGAEDEGIVLLSDGVPARQVRFKYVDTVRLRTESAGTSIAVTYPREEIRFLPLNLY